MFFKTRQGEIRLTENLDGDGILMTVDDDMDDQQSKANLPLATAKRFRDELSKLIEKIEGAK